MRKSWGLTIGAAAVALAALTPGVALAAPAQPTPPTPNGDTATTFDVGASGTLQISAPTTADLTANLTTPVPPGGTIVGDLGLVTVTDLRSETDATWTASVSSTAFTDGLSPNQTIPAADLAYNPNNPAPAGALTTTFGSIASLVGTPVAALSIDAAPTVIATGVDGDNQATWNPVITVSVPGTAVAGTYSGTITHSVL
jgi:hypothetical protein